MKKYTVGVVGATGMVGQRFVTLLENHSWFQLTVVAASARSAGKSYEEAVGPRWAMTTPIPEEAKSLVVLDALADRETIASSVDFIFCAVDMKKEEIRALEESYAKLECPVISNNSAHRWTPDVPMVIPEHLQVIQAQKSRLGTRRGFIAVKSNCSIQSYAPALHPLRRFGITQVLVCTYQAISGAGKTFTTWPEMVDNVIPYIGGEEEKSEQEPLKVWGTVEHGQIVPAAAPSITAQCLRVPVSDGHTAAVFVSFREKPSVEEIKTVWKNFQGRAQELALPSAPKQFLHYFEENDRPQAKLDRDLEGGMAVSLGRLRPDTQYDYKFVGLSHNTLRGAAGGGVLLALFLGVAPRRAPVVHPHQAGVGKPFGAADGEGAGAAADVQQGAPAVPGQMVRQILVDLSHETAPVEVEQNAAAKHVQPEYHGGGQQSPHKERKCRGAIQNNQQDFARQKRTGYGGQPFHEGQGDPVPIVCFLVIHVCSSFR